ncbi:MAG: hypothetical protein ABI836_04515 [Gemmatimonadota bacterium]
MLRTTGLAAISLLVIVGRAAAQEHGEENEKKITRAEIPAAVEHTVAAQTRGATIKGFAKEEEDGKTAYEVSMTVHGHSRDVLISPAGLVLEVEEEVVLDSLPPVIKAGLVREANGGRIHTVETLTKGGVLVAYEAHVTTNSHRWEVQVGPDGKKLDHEE